MDTTQNQMAVSVLNASRNSVKLKQNVSLGTVHPVEVVSVCDLDTEKVKDTGKVKVTEGEKKSFSHLKPLVEDASGNLTDSQRQRLSDLVSEFQDVFMTPGGNLNQTNLAEHFRHWRRQTFQDAVS